MHTLKIGRKPYAVGFWWQVYSENPSKRRAKLEEAREQASRTATMEYDAVVIRPDQYGLARFEGKPVKALSLASAMLKRSESSWIGLFKIDEQNDLWWVCAVSHRLIAGDGDYCANEADARERFQDLKLLTDWNNEVVCEDTASSLEYIQSILSSGEKVMPLAGEPLGRQLLIGALLLLVLAGGWQAWTMYQARIEASRAAEAARQAALAQKTSISPDQVFSRNWHEKPLPSVLGRACLEASHFPLFDRGWKLQGIIYTETGISVSWEHMPGASFDDRPDSTIINEKTPTVIRANFPLKVKAGRKIRPLADKEAVVTDLFELTRLTGTRLSFNWQEPETKTVERGSLPPLSVTAPWVKGTWKLNDVSDAVLLSADFFMALDDIPGLVLTRLSRKNFQNSMEGVVYALQ